MFRTLPLLLCSAAIVDGFARTPARMAWLREAEKKHGRVALLAVPTIAAIAATTQSDPVGWLNAQPADVQLTFYAAAGALESFNLARFDKGFTLKSDEVPGKVLPVKNVPEALDKVEDLAGRVAMIAATATLLQSVAA